MCFPLDVESKEQNKPRNKSETDSETQRADWWLPDGRAGLGDREEGVKGSKLQTESYGAVTGV